MSQAEEVIKIASCNCALNDLGNDFSFRLHSLTLAKINVDRKDAYRFLISNDRHAIDLDRDEGSVLALSHSFLFDRLSSQSHGREFSTFFALISRHDALVNVLSSDFAQRKSKNILKFLVGIHHDVVFIDDDDAHRRVREKLLEASRLYQNLLLRALAIGDVAADAN